MQVSYELRENQHGIGIWKSDHAGLNKVLSKCLGSGMQTKSLWTQARAHNALLNHVHNEMKRVYSSFSCSAGEG